jgi:probable HAF family extracellular repeat protein
LDVNFAKVLAKRRNVRLKTKLVMKMNPSFLMVCGIVLANASPSVAQGQHPHYRGVDLGVIGDSTWSSATHINNRGEVVGSLTRFSGGTVTFRAFLYRGGVMTDLGTLPDRNWAMIADINNYGAYAGWVPGSVFPAAALPPQGFELSAISALSDSNVVIGEFENLATRTVGQGFVYQNGNYAVLNGLGGQSYCRARALNNAGTIVGESLVEGNHHRAVFYVGTNAIELQTFSDAVESTASAINDAGYIAGSAVVPDGLLPTREVAFIYRNGIVTPLGELVPHTYTHVNAMNNADEIVGSAQTLPGYPSFLYTAGKIYDFSSITIMPDGWGIAGVFDINDLGWISGMATKDGVYHAFIFKPLGHRR